MPIVKAPPLSISRLAVILGPELAGRVGCAVESPGVETAARTMHSCFIFIFFRNFNFLSSDETKSLDLTQSVEESLQKTPLGFLIDGGERGNVDENSISRNLKFGS